MIKPNEGKSETDFGKRLCPVLLNLLDVLAVSKVVKFISNVIITNIHVHIHSETKIYQILHNVAANTWMQVPIHHLRANDS